MARKRVARLNEQLKRELMQLIQYEVKDPRIGLVTITGVEVTPDLYHAKVYWTLQGSDEEREQALQGLRAAAGFMRGEIGRRMRIRRAPELHFSFDSTLEHAMHIERLLREARAGSVMADDDDGSADDVASGADAGFDDDVAGAGDDGFDDDVAGAGDDGFDDDVAADGSGGARRDD